MLLQLCTICLHTVFAAKYDKQVEGVSFMQWVSKIVSRSIYLVLITLIIGCVLISAYRNKKQQKRLRNEVARARKSIISEETDASSWVANLWKKPQMFSLQSPGFFGGSRGSPSLDLIEDEGGMKERLRDTEVAVAALKEELDLANKARLEFETALETIERDRSHSDDELRKTKLNTSLELEDMKKEISQLQRQLSQAQTEKIQLSKDLEAISRENRITDSALRDQQNLTTRLEEARAEIKVLQNMMNNMRSERDSAVKIASELVAKAKGVSKECGESRKLIRGILENSNIPFTFDAIGDCGKTSKYRSDNEWIQNNEDENNKHDFRNSFDEENGIEMENDTMDADNTASRLVTNSPEFRAFLQATFQASSSLLPNDDDD